MRGFFGLEVPEMVSVALDTALATPRRELPPARWVPAADRHLTLVFLGVVEDLDLPRLNDSLGPVFAAGRPLELELGDCGTFPAGRPGRVVWVGLRPSKELNRLQKAVAEVCRVLDFDIERRPFSPHLTLARCRKPWPRRACDAWRDGFSGAVGTAIQGRAFAVNRGCLFASVQGRQGVRYDVVRSYPLGSRGLEAASASQGGK